MRLYEIYDSSITFVVIRLASILCIPKASPQLSLTVLNSQGDRAVIQRLTDGHHNIQHDQRVKATTQPSKGAVWGEKVHPQQLS